MKHLKAASRRLTRSERTFDIVAVVLFLIVLFVLLYPLYFVLIASFSDPKLVNSGRVLVFIKGFNLEGYDTVFRDGRLMRGYRNTIIYTTSATFLNVWMTLLLAYPLSRRDFGARKVITFFVIFTMYFGGGLIPTYILTKKLGLLDNPLVMIITGVGAYNVILSRSFIQSSIPHELAEAAKVDGCGDFAFFFKILVPLSRALISVLVIYYGVGHWNSYFRAMIYLNNEKLYPLQLVLKNILAASKIDAKMGQALALQYRDYGAQTMLYETVKYSSIVLSTLPMMIIYPFMQKYFEQGVIIGSLKG